MSTQRVTPESKIGALLEAHPELEAVLIGLAPQFKALSNPVLRRTVARVATVEQAARVGGLKVHELVGALRHALGQPGEMPAADGTAAPQPSPSWLTGAAVCQTIDAAAILASGGSPVGHVMSALTQAPSGAVLRLDAPFEPAPLIDAVRARGHEVFSEPAGGGAATVWIRAAM